MIIVSDHKEATVSSKVETYNSSIALNAETFNIIMSGIYSDKILAAVREPIFNALDSHIEAGKTDVAIKIHAPTNLEPWFSIQDFGIGMSKDTVTQLFMSLGTSTKRESNELVGAKGIGSKAPFSITDMFNVTSIFEGMRTSYSVYKDRGIPKIAVLNNEQTNSPNGVEVKFSVEPGQVDPMREALYKCLSFVSSPYEINDPYVKEVIDSKKPKVTYSREIDGWKLEFHSNRESNQNCVVMGQQPYLSAILSEYPPCAVFVPIGTCDVSPGREHTEEGEEDGGFSEKLKAFVEKVSGERGKEITDALDKTKDITEAYDYFNSVKSSYFVTRYGYNWLRDRVYAVMGSHEAICKLSYEEARHGRAKSWRDESHVLTPLELVNCPAVLYADKKSALKRRSEHLMQEKQMKRCFIVSPDDAGACLAEDEYFKPLFVYATSFNAPKQPAQARTRTGNIRVCIIPRDGVGYSQWVSKGDMAEVEHYMVKSSKQGGDHTWAGAFSQIRNSLGNNFELFGVDGEEVWLVSEAAAKNLPATAKEVTPQVWVEKTKRAWLRHKVAGSGIIQKKRELKNTFGIKTLPLGQQKDFDFVVGYYEQHKLHRDSVSTDRIQKIFRRYSEIYDKKAEEVKQKYPLLKRMGMCYYNDRDFVEYRTLIDNKGDK